MAVKLRLMRMGKTKQPTYRVVAADSRSPRDGAFIEIVGQYNPRANPSATLRRCSVKSRRARASGGRSSPLGPASSPVSVDAAWPVSSAR